MDCFIGRWGDSKIVEYSILVEKLRTVNCMQRPVWALYLYGNLVYNTMYRIMRLYKNYPSWPWTSSQTEFNKTMAQLQIEVE